LCGIAGIATRDDRPPSFQTLDVLANALAHRGPDGTGRYADKGIGLVNTRLAIIDLKTGDQPFQTGEAVSVINGEIYNDLEIRASLPYAAYRSRSDGESALHLYCDRGDRFTAGLRGMYALAVYDRRSAKLVLARDPFGIKPLYYVSTPDGFAFASEIQALVRAGLAVRGIDPRERAELFQLKFTTGRRTIFPEVSRVQPGETMIVSGNQIVERRRQRALPATRP